MQVVLIKKPNKIYLNSFRPLCMTEIGRNAVEKYNHPPFIDASCRREPDFENPFPTISAICRGGSFAPRLRKNDVVVYLTVKKRYYDDKATNNKLIAILQVDEIFDTHQKGFKWFSEKGILVPSNCLIEGNSPYDFDHTASRYETKIEVNEFLNRPKEEQAVLGRRMLRDWDNYYKEKVNEWPMFIKTNPLYVELNNPISFYDEDLRIVFGEKIPNTRNPPTITFGQLEKIAAYVGINLKINDV
jgi:hypothetical protein